MLNPELRSELLAMYAADQELRVRIIRNTGDQELAAQIRALDLQHTARMQAIVSEYGWPRNNSVGVDGVNAAWLLVQHADHEKEFQKQCLELMTATSPDEVSREHVAYLTDRVRMNAGELQLYGVGFHWDENGVFSPLPIEDPENVDIRRAQMGMDTLAEHTEFMNRTYGSVVKAAQED